MSLTKVSYAMIDGAVFNILDYGADSTGIADSTTEIQMALDNAFNAGGGIVFVPAGEYKISKPLIVRSNVVLEGVGAGSQIKQSVNYNGAGNLIHIGYGYEWNQNGQSFNPASNDDATITQLLSDDFTKLTTKNAGARNLYIEGYINGNRPGLGLWFINAFECFCDHLWVKNTLIPVTVGNDAAGWQAGCANISVSNVWQVSCDPTTDGTDAGSFSWFDLLYMGSAVYVNISRMFNNPNTPAALNNKIQTAGTCYFSISDCIFHGTYLNADVGIGINSNGNADTIGANIYGNTFIHTTTGVGLYKTGGTKISQCSVTGNIFNSNYVGIELTGASSGDCEIASNLYINNSYADVLLGSYTNFTNKNYTYGTWFLNGNANISNPGIAVMRWNSSAYGNGLVMLDEDSSGTGRYAIQFFRNTSVVGSVQTTLTATSYVTASDYRLKEQTKPISNALEKIKLLKPVEFKWKINGNDGLGFIAHELQDVFPDAVVGEKDAINEDGTEHYQAIDAGSPSIIATLVSAIQELKAEIDLLKGQK